MSKNKQSIEENHKINKKLLIDVKENKIPIKSLSPPRRQKFIKDDFIHVDKIDYKKCIYLILFSV